MFLRFSQRPITLTRLAALAGLIPLATPGMEATPTSLTLDAPATSVKRFPPGSQVDFGSLPDAPNKTPGWNQIMFEGGGDFPNFNSWNVFDGDPASGEDTWDDVTGGTCRVNSGNWSIWCADIGDSMDCVDYDNDQFSWMIFGPFNLTAGSDGAQMLFSAWSEVEDDFDTVFVGASTNGTNFFGSTLSQDFDWTDFTFDLTNVFTLGDLRGQQVWIAFVFTSDASVAVDEGVYLDDILIEELPAGSGCVPSATRLYLPGNGRFSVTMDFFTVQGTGNSGPAQAIELDTLGLTSGGLFYFTNPTDPQVLIKVVNGCPVNNRWWVFYAATTNVGFDITVTDTQNGLSNVYSNPDINAAPPVQDTQAFATCP